MFFAEQHSAVIEAVKQAWRSRSEGGFMALTEKELLRLEIERLTAEFLRKGGKVQQLSRSEGYFADQPVKRARRDQVVHIKKFGARRRG